jgi:hypothetical protein
MFNAPRPAQRYVGTSTTGFGASFVDENPLSSSAYDDGLDPWSAAPSPTPTPIPQGSSSIFSSVIGMLEVLFNVWWQLNEAVKRTPRCLQSITLRLLLSTQKTQERRLLTLFRVFLPRHPYQLLPLTR